MYFGDHPPPHFHARYSGESARFEIASGEVIEGHRIRTTFSDGAIEEIDLGELVAAGGVFKVDL